MKKLKLFFALFAMLALGVGNAWGAEASITFKDEGLSNGVQYTDPFELDANTTITFAGGGNDGKYYTTGEGIRTYGGGTITVECTNGTISEISFTWSGNSYKPTADVATPAGYSTSTGKWTGSASSVTLTRPSGSGHWRLQSVTVTYETSGSGTEEPGVYLRPKNSDFLVVKITPFSRQFSTIFSFIFSLSSAYLLPIFCCECHPRHTFAYHSISTTQLMVTPRKTPFQASTVTFSVVTRW